MIMKKREHALFCANCNEELPEPLVYDSGHFYLGRLKADRSILMFADTKRNSDEAGNEDYVLQNPPLPPGWGGGRVRCLAMVFLIEIPAMLGICKATRVSQFGFN